MTATVATPGTSEIFGDWLTDRHWAPSKLTYSFPAGGWLIGYGDPADYSALGAGQKRAVRQVMEEISSLTKLTLTEVTESADTQATLRFMREAWLSGAYAYEPGAVEKAGDSFYGAEARNPVTGNEAHLYFLHEIGHTLGLAHGHESSRFAGSAFDSQEYTLMTYADYVGDPHVFDFDSGPVDWAQSYMQLDIAALQYLYGANYAAAGEAWSGDTVYGFDPDTGEMFVNGIGTGAPAGNRIFRTIWDGHGSDTYDLSSYGAALDIDLAPGAWSTFSKAQLADLNRHSADPGYLAAGNVANARLVGGDLRGLIENATGGSGSDTIRGNQAANVLIGGEGQDTLVGRAGGDLLRGNRGDDLLKGGGQADRLFGGREDDDLRGGAGDDRLRGGDGADRLLGEAGRDSLFGGEKNDRLEGGPGDDRLAGGPGADWHYGGEGADAIDGEAGADRLFGGDGGDTLAGGAGGDILRGQSGADELRGGSGDDILVGGGGTDRLFGGGGADLFRFSGAGASPVSAVPDEICDFQTGADRIDLSGFDAAALALDLRGTFAGGAASAITRESGGGTRVLVDVDGDGSADFRLLVAGVTGLTFGDFLL